MIAGTESLCSSLLHPTRNADEDPSLMRSYRKDRGKDGHGGEDDDEEEAARKKEARRRRNKERQRQERKKREKRERQISRVTSRRHGRRR